MMMAAFARDFRGIHACVRASAPNGRTWTTCGPRPPLQSPAMPTCSAVHVHEHARLLAAACVAVLTACCNFTRTSTWYLLAGLLRPQGTRTHGAAPLATFYFRSNSRALAFSILLVFA